MSSANGLAQQPIGRDFGFRIQQLGHELFWKWGEQGEGLLNPLATFL